MNATLAILQVESSETRASQVLLALETAGRSVIGERVGTEEQMRAALESGAWDAIVADDRLPGFSAFAALRLLRRMRVDVPLVVVSDSIGMERAVQLMREGARDCMTMEGLSRLEHAVRREMRAAAARRERALSDAHLSQTRKLDAVRRLAGGVGHGINNLLQVIQGYGRLALDAVPPRGDAKPHLEEVLRAVEKARILVLKLLTFARRECAPDNPIDLDGLLSGLSPMLSRLLGEEHELAALGDGRPMSVRADPAEIEQVLVNLCMNAKEAMPSGGTIRVDVTRIRFGPEFCGENPWARPGDFAVLTVSDAGAGMTPETLTHLFEPFFTTKPPGKGAGLGLAMVYGIVKQHDGFLNVQSAVGKGTTVDVYMPLAEPLAPGFAAVARRAARGGTETILLAEDDESVRGFTVRVLQGAGYTLHTASDGEEAVRLFESCGGSVDLAIIDVIMPRVGGTALAEKLRQTRPRLPVLFSTGYAFRLFEEGFVPSAGIEVIRKPFTHVELLRRVRGIIDAARVETTGASPTG